MRKTPLHKWHVQHGAKMIPFAGWEMPLAYSTGALEEHRRVRANAGLFDVGHMGRIEVQGREAVLFLDKIITADVCAVQEGSSVYGLLLNEDGGIKDDLILYRLTERWILVVNAATKESDLAWLRSQGEALQVSVKDISDQTHMMALQGPQSLTIAGDLFGEKPIITLPRFGTLTLDYRGKSFILGRTGYTGEDGYELLLPCEIAEEMWEKILKSREAQDGEVSPIGLAARDSLRFEAGFALYGAELTEERTPWETRLGWACCFEREFVGRETLLEQRERGIEHQLATIKMTDKGVPREGYVVFSDEGERVGKIVSGMYAPTVELYAGNIVVEAAFSAVGTELLVEIRGKKKRAVVVKRPLYRSPRIRSKRE